jgi:hypothetical protein
MASIHSRIAPTIYIIVIVVSLLATFVYKLRFSGIFACPSAGYAQDAYLADCNALSYGDFDHGAFWYALDEPSRAAAAEADVLFLGSSRLQFALSGKPLAEWSKAASVRHFLLGFSQTENTQYFGPLLKRLRPGAKAYVINVDRFFDDRMTSATGDILRDPETADRYRDKHRWQPPHHRVCSTVPWVCGDALAVFRARQTGAWTRLGKGSFVASGTSEGVPQDQARWPEFIRQAREFVAKLPVQRECVVLTMVPTFQSRTAEARAIAAALELPLVLPTVDGLRTFDGSHLDAPSADRWAKAFIDMAGGTLTRCARSRAG